MVLKRMRQLAGRFSSIKIELFEPEICGFSSLLAIAAMPKT
jgi:hypothetical protein